MLRGYIYSGHSVNRHYGNVHPCGKLESSLKPWRSQSVHRLKRKFMNRNSELQSRMRIKKRNWINRLTSGWMVACLCLLMIIPLAILLGLLFKALPLLYDQQIWDLLAGTQWSPMKGNFGFLPFIVSSMMVTALSIIFAAPMSLLTAIYITQFAPKRLL